MSTLKRGALFYSYLKDFSLLPLVLIAIYKITDHFGRINGHLSEQATKRFDYLLKPATEKKSNRDFGFFFTFKECENHST